jgi:hypothetical protein
LGEVVRVRDAVGTVLLSTDNLRLGEVVRVRDAVGTVLLSTDANE